MSQVVMLVDDNDADLVYTEVVLLAKGIAREVLSFDTAGAALDFLREGRTPVPELVLLDLNMPEMDGFAFIEAYAALRGSMREPPRVVVLTSSPEAGDERRARSERWVTGYLVKPIEPDALLAVLSA